jgi:hypothetical protein
MVVRPFDRGMATGGAWTSGSTPGLAVTASGPDRLVDRLPSEVSRAAVAAAKRADVLVIDRRTSGTRTERTGEADIAGRTVLVVPKRPGARPSVTCYSTEAPEADPAVELIRRTVELDATADAHFGVASAVAVASGDEPPSGDVGGSADWVAADEQEDGLDFGTPDATETSVLPTPDHDPAPDGGGPTSRTGHASVSPSAAELAARRDSVDTAASRVLEEGPDAAAPLAFCGLSAVVEPLDGV